MALFKINRKNVEEVLEQEMEYGEEADKPELILFVDDRIDGLQELIEGYNINVSKIRCELQKIENDIMACLSIVNSSIVIVETGKGFLRSYNNIKILMGLRGIKDNAVKLTVMYSSEEVYDIFKKNKNVKLVRYTGIVSLLTELRKQSYKIPNRVINDWDKVAREGTDFKINEIVREHSAKEEFIDLMCNDENDCL